MTASLVLPRPQPPQLIDLPGGAFTMGRPDRRPDERPPHTVTLRPFRAAPTPVTNAAYDLFLRHTRHDPPRFFDDPRLNQPRQPVVGVSWFDAVAYCDWLAAATGLPLRLPSEAEREYAALGAHSGVNGAGGDWPWGDTDPPNPDQPSPDQPSPDQTSPDQTGYAPLAFVASADAPHIPQPACANAYGLRCMAENVHEWCADTYRRTYDPAPHPAIPVDTSPTDPATVDPTRRRVSRGGSWRHRIKFSRVSARSSLRPDARYNDYGFRLYASL